MARKLQPVPLMVLLQVAALDSRTTGGRGGSQRGVSGQVQPKERTAYCSAGQAGKRQVMHQLGRRSFSLKYSYKSAAHIFQAAA